MEITKKEYKLLPETCDLVAEDVLKFCSKSHVDNKDAIICVMGCYSQLNYEDVKNLVDNISIILGNNDKSKLLEYIEEYQKNKKQIIKIDDLNKVCFEDMRLDGFQKHTRAFVKIQDGCNNYCSYCIIPFARGKSRSADSKFIIEQINSFEKMVLKKLFLREFISDNGEKKTDKQF